MSTVQQAMQDALEGSLEATRQFFELFLDTPLFVPERRQSPALEESVSYPNDLVNVLGVQGKEQVYVPAFFSEEDAADWCGKKLKCRAVKGQNLLELVPEGWWISVNPGFNVEKEISSWEIEQLRAGSEGIEAILSEFSSELETETVDLRELKTGEFLDTIQALKSYALTQLAVKKIWAAVEELEGAPAECALYIGVLAACAERKELAGLREQAQATAERSLIGANPVRVYVDVDEDGFMLALFRGMKAL